MKGIVVYDSWTGNTKKVAEAIAQTANFQIKSVNDISDDLRSHELLLLGTPDIHGGPTPKITDFLKKVQPPKKFVLFATFGVPIWGMISSAKCLKSMRERLEEKGGRFLRSFRCPGYHKKFKTYKGRPSDKDLQRAALFARKITQL